MRRTLGIILAAAATLAAGVDEDLLAAARKGDAPAVAALLEKGAAIETTTPYGQTPLYLAAIAGHEAAVRALLEKGAKVDVRDTFYKASMLAFVIQRKHYGIAKILMEQGGGPADDNLEAAVRSGRLELVQTALTKSKASQAALDKTYEMALDSKQAEIGEALRSAGAKAPVVVAVDPQVLASYAGNYKAEQGLPDIKISVKEEKLAAQAVGQPEFPLKAKSTTEFEFAPAGILMVFDSESGFQLRQGGRTFQFKKAVAQ